MRFRRLLVFALTLSCCLARWAHAGPDLETLLEAEPFSVDADTMQQIANVAGENLEDGSIDVLVNDTRCVLDVHGRRTVTTRRVFRQVSREVTQRDLVVQAAWAPWYQERPRIQARVISREGSIFELDPKTIESVRIPSSNPQVFTDHMLLRAPLPAVRQGCIIETTITARDHQPFASSGVQLSVVAAELMHPVKRLRIQVEHPSATHLAFEVLGCTVVPEVKESDGIRQVTFNRTNAAAAIKGIEANVPSSVDQFPKLAISTAKDWNSVAQEYTAIVENQLKGSNVDDLVRPYREKKLSQRMLIAALVSRVHELARYTGIEFGSSAMVPSAPEVTLRRGYGDCKDKSTLLVAMLRACRIPAHVALVNAGDGGDINQGLPGLSSFNHVVVRVRGESPLWIDATAESTPLGELPATIQGRFALIVANDTKQLDELPISPAERNRIVHHQHIRMNDTSHAALDLGITTEGIFASEYRNHYGSLNRSDLEQFAKQLGEVQYGSSDLATVDHSLIANLDEPFKVEFSFRDSARAAVNHPHALALVLPGIVLQPLPTSLFAEPFIKEEAGPTDEIDRQRPFEAIFPFQATATYRLSPPPGFTPLEVPTGRVIQFGPGTFRSEYRVENDRDVIATFRFELPSRRFTAAEVNEARKTYYELAEESGQGSWGVAVRFQQTAGTHLLNGRTREGVRAYRELLDRFPSEAWRHAQLAQAVLAAGLREEADFHARKAVELAPAESFAYESLAFVLSHGRLGIYLGRGMDRNGAIAAYRKALELESDDAYLHSGIGELLEFDRQGHRLLDRELGPASQEYQRAYASMHLDEFLDLALTTAFLSGDIDGANELARDADASDVRTLMDLVLVTERKGAQAGIQRAQQLIRDVGSRQAALERLASTLNILRRYDRAKEMVESLIQTSHQPDAFESMLKQFKYLKRHENIEFADDDPRKAAFEYLKLRITRGKYSSAASTLMWNSSDEYEPGSYFDLARWLDDTGSALKSNGLRTDRIADTLSLLSFEMADEIENRAFRISVRNKIDSDVAWDVFVVHTNEQFLIVRPGVYDEGLGAIALQELQAGKKDVARKWLKWSADRQQGTVGWFNQFQGTPFARLWLSARRNDDVLLAACAALAVRSPPAKDVLQVLNDVRPNLSKLEQTQVDRARLGPLFDLKMYESMIDVANSLLAVQPTAFQPFLFKNHALRQLGRDQEAREVTLAHVKKYPRDELALLSALYIHTAAGESQAATSKIEKLNDLPQLAPRLARGIAWAMLFQDEVPDDALRHANYAVDYGFDDPVRSLQVLAAVRAEQDRVNEAALALQSAWGLSSANEPLALDLYVLGRIAESCGMKESAKRYYQRVKESEDQSIVSTYDLAQQRLARLESDDNL